MAMPNDIVLDGQTFSLVSNTANSSLRKDPARDAVSPATLRIASETTKNGQINSVIQLVDATLVPCGTGCSIVPLMSEVKLQLKLSYNPLEGRTDIDTAITDLRADLTAFMADTSLMTKFLNQEH